MVGLSAPYTPALADASRVASVYARAMAEDPLNVCFLPDPAERARALRALYAAIVRAAVRAGSLHATSPAIEGVALWELPGMPAFTARSVFSSGILGLLPRVGLAPCFRMGRYEAWAGRLRSRLAPPPAAHLVLLAVDPDCQGRGWAGRLLRPALAELDAAGLSCCLETQNPANVPLYEHFGLAVLAEARIPGTEVGHWLMVRRPIQGPAGATGR